MNAMTCHEVESQLDLLAAGECDRPTRRAVESHLDHCAACAASFAESQRLLGLLDRHWDETGPERVRQRIEQEERRSWRRQVVLPFVRRAAALAALVLVALGLGLWSPASDRSESQPELQLAALESRADAMPKIGQEAVVRAMEMLPARVKQPAIEVPGPGRSGDAFRRELLQAQRAGKLLPPMVLPRPLDLELRNIGDRALEFRIGDSAADLSLDVVGRGVVRVPAVGVEPPAFLRPRPIRLEPGAVETLRIDHLIDGSVGRLHYLYLTEPGDYLLTARLRVMIGKRVATVTSRTASIKVGE